MIRLLSTNKTMNNFNNKTKVPWTSFIFLFAVFYFATWYKPLYTIQDPITAESIIHLTEEGNLGRRIALISLGAFGLFCFLDKRRSRVCINGFLGWLIIFFLSWSLFSIVWSDDSFLTIRRVVVLIMLWTGAVGIAARFSFDDIISFAFFSSFLTLILGILCEIFLGTLHPIDIDYRFAGTFHPNSQGANCGILVISSFFLARTVKKHSYFYSFMTIIALIFLLLTKSRTAFASTIIASSAYFALTSSMSRKATIVCITVILVCLAYFAFGDYLIAHGKTALLLGRDDIHAASLNLRIPLWGECLDYIAQRPFLGYGFNTFWTPSRTVLFSAHQGQPIPHSHSGYIELALHIGIIGSGVFVSILLLGIKRSIFLLKTQHQHTYAFAFAMLIWLCLTMVMEIINMHSFIANFICIIILSKISFFDISH